MSSLGELFTIVKGNDAIQSQISSKDKVKILRTISVIDIGSFISSILMLVVCLVCAIFIIADASSRMAEAKRERPEMPIEIGIEPVERVIDTTGFIGESSIDDISGRLNRMSNSYNIQFALYSSDEPAHDIYDDFFSDENGVLIYLEEHEQNGILKYYFGSNLSDIFTTENIELINKGQTYLDYFTHDRASNIVTDLNKSLDKLLHSSDGDKDSAIITYAAGIFWVILGIIFFKAMPKVVRVCLGVPSSKKSYKEFKRWANSL